jgi:hypothetical protein
MKCSEFIEYCLDLGGKTTLFGTTFRKPVEMGVMLGNFHSIDMIVGMDNNGRCVGIHGLRYDISGVRIRNKPKPVVEPDLPEVEF